MPTRQESSYEHTSLDLEMITALRTQCEIDELTSPNEYIAHLRNIATITKWEDRSVILSMVRAAQKRGYWKTLNLGSALEALIFKLLGSEVSYEAPSSFLQESGSHILEKAIPNPLEVAERSLIIASIALLDKSEMLFAEVLRAASWLTSLIDYNGVPFHGLFTIHSECERRKLGNYIYLLFSTIARVSGDEKWERLSDRVTKSSKEELTSYELFLRDTLRNLSARQISFSAPIEEENVLPIVSKCKERYSAAVTLCGANTGVGSIHYKNVAVPSFGPHFAALGDVANYGIFRPANLGNDSFKEISITKDRLVGWAPLIDPESAHIQAGKSWMHSDIELANDHILIKARFIKEEEVSLSFVFFVSAKEVKVGEELFFPGSMKRYSDIAKPLSLQGDVSITPLHDGAMEVIPLAGGDYFWGAGFLVAFPITSEKTRYAWRIT